MGENRDNSLGSDLRDLLEDVSYYGQRWAMSFVIPGLIQMDISTAILKNTVDDQFNRNFEVFKDTKENEIRSFVNEKDWHGTITVGSLLQGLSPVGSLSYAKTTSYDMQLNKKEHNVPGSGAGFPPSAAGLAMLMFTGAEDVDALDGPAFQIGASIDFGLSVGVDWVFASEYSGIAFMGGAGVAALFPVEGHAEVTNMMPIGEKTPFFDDDSMYPLLRAWHGVEQLQLLKREKSNQKNDIIEADEPNETTYSPKSFREVEAKAAKLDEYKKNTKMNTSYGMPTSISNMLAEREAQIAAEKMKAYKNSTKMNTSYGMPTSVSNILSSRAKSTAPKVTLPQNTSYGMPSSVSNILAGRAARNKTVKVTVSTQQSTNYTDISSRIARELMI